MAVWHQQLPTRYSSIERFNHGFVSKLPVKDGSTTLEIGAGIGAHSKFEDLTRQQYYIPSRVSPGVLRRAPQAILSSDRVRHGDIERRQPWQDGFFDRIVAIHVLEHLRNLPSAVAEIRRLLKPDGFFDVVLPCEGGFAYSVARKISAERLFRKRFGMDYTPIIRNEHVSTSFDGLSRNWGACSTFAPGFSPSPSGQRVELLAWHSDSPRDP